MIDDLSSSRAIVKLTEPTHAGEFFFMQATSRRHALRVQSAAELCVASQNIDLALRVCQERVMYRFFPGLSVYKFVLPRLAHMYMPSLRNANAGFRLRPEDNLCHSYSLWPRASGKYSYDST